MDPVDWFFGLLRWDNPVYNAYDATRTWIVTWANDHFFHIRPVLVQPGGSGDTSFMWAYVCCIICVTAVGAVGWSLAAGRHANYRRLGYWFRNYLRYYLITFSVLYGLAKILLDQMGTLDLAGLSTQVGDLSPMRLCWYFIAASPPYQIFSGMAELLVAILLLNRRTVTLGLLVGFAVFGNVMLLNYSYDIPVKILSTELVLCFFVLLFRDYERLIRFLILNKPAGRTDLYDPVFLSKKFRILRLVLKSTFIFGVLIVPAWQLIKDHYHGRPAISEKGFPPGIYDITGFTRNGDSSLLPERRWTRLVLEASGNGTLQGDSCLFRYKYGHTVFSYHPDSTKRRTLLLFGHVSSVPDSRTDSIFMHYEMVSPGFIRVRAKAGTDSLQFDAKISAHRYALRHWQFHWLTEYTP